jgi:hypothetical protein
MSVHTARIAGQAFRASHFEARDVPNLTSTPRLPQRASQQASNSRSHPLMSVW